MNELLQYIATTHYGLSTLFILWFILLNNAKTPQFHLYIKKKSLFLYFNFYY